MFNIQNQDFELVLNILLLAVPSPDTPNTFLTVFRYWEEIKKHIRKWVAVTDTYIMLSIFEMLSGIILKIKRYLFLVIANLRILVSLPCRSDQIANSNGQLYDHKSDGHVDN